VRYPGGQAAQQRKVLGALCFAFQALALGHFVVQGSGTLGHALLEDVVGLLLDGLGLFPWRDVEGHTHQARRLTGRLI
jgi:hypothetical protein